MKKKNNKSIMQEMREIRDKISLEMMDMSFEEMKEYLAKHSKIHDSSVWKRKYKQESKTSVAAEPKVPYGKK